MTTRLALPVLLLIAAASIAPAAAQNPPAANPAPKSETEPPHLDRKACADDRRATVGAGDTLQAHEPDKPGTPGEKLARTDGVICPPPDIDPDIRAPAPGGGALQVLPPPGGADPAVRPR